MATLPAPEPMWDPPRRDWWLLILGVLGVAGTIVLLLFWDRGWPVARIPFAVLQADAEPIARQFLADAEIDLTGFHVVVSFETDRNAQNYLERVAGRQALDRIADDDVTIWRWRVRFFRELDAREYAVGVLPSGRVSGWSQTLAEANPRATLAEDDARALADREAATWSRGDQTWRPAGVSVQTLPQRVDYRFTYERDDWTVGDATHRRVVTVHGDRLGGVVDFLNVPDAWVRAQRIETNRGVVLAVAGWTVTSAIGLAAMVAALWAWTVGRLAWRPAAAISLALLGVSVIALANQLPVWMAGYTTTATMSAYLAGLARDQVGQLGPTVVVAGVAVAAALAIWPRAFPNQPHPADDLRLRALATRRFVRSMIVGYAAAGAWLGYFTLYYWVGASAFGVWSPLELPYRDVMSGVFPAAFPLFVGLAAALAEESVFRLFALPAGVLALRTIWRLVTGSSPGPRGGVICLAVVIVGVAGVWGSLHSTYPQQPFFIRALELTVTGALAALVFLRWGFWAVALTHYVGNASVAGALFLLSGNLGLQAAAVTVILLPLLLLIPAGVARLRGGNLPERVVSDAAPAATLARTLPDDPPAQARPRWGIAPLIILPIALAILAVSTHAPRPTDSLRVGVSREMAEAIAGRYVLPRDTTNRPWIVTSDFVNATTGLETTYLLRALGPGPTTEMFARGHVAPGWWLVRFSRPLEKEEWLVRVGSDGRVIGFTWIIDDAEPGASPDVATAETIARRGAAAVIADSDRWRLVDSSQVKQENRLDSAFVLELPEARYGEATIRLHVGLLGDAVGSVRAFVKAPDAFLREANRLTTLETALGAARDVLLVVGVGAGAALLLRAARSGAVRWRTPLTVGLIAAAVWLVGQAAEYPTLLAQYRNTLDMPSFLIWQWSLRLRELMLLTASVIALTALVTCLARDASIPRRLGRWDDTIGGVGLAVAIVAGGLLLWNVRALVAPDTLRASATTLPFGAAHPLFAAIASAALDALTVGLGVTAAALVIERLTRLRWTRWVIVAGSAALWLAADARGAHDAVFSAVAGITMGVVAYGLWLAAGRSVWTAPIAVGLASLGGKVFSLWRAEAVSITDLAPIVVIVAGAIGWGAFFTSRRARVAVPRRPIR